MVGLRVFDVGALVVWLVWFFRLRDDDDDDGDDFRRGKGDAPRARGALRRGGLRLPLPASQPWHARRRDHAGDRKGASPAPHRRVPAAGAGPRAGEALPAFLRIRGEHPEVSSLPPGNR